MSDLSFADLTKPTVGKGKCPRCGRPSACILGLNIYERQYEPRGRSNHGRQLASRHRTLCEPCGVEIYHRLLARFEELLEQAPLNGAGEAER